VTPSPVKEAALALGIPVSHAMDDVVGVGAELAVVVAYGRIIPAHLLAQLPMINVHFSLLPRWRGAAPLERAILSGDRQTGICIMQVEEGLDTGGVYARRVVPLTNEIDLDTLRQQLVAVGSELLVEVLSKGADGLPAPEPQVGEVTNAEKITTEDLHLQWGEPAEQLQRVVRLGRAWTTFRGRRLGVVSARAQAGTSAGAGPGTLEDTMVHTGGGLLQLLMVQPESRTPMSAEDWVRGIRPAVGERLGSG
jgi:methionyl-tRNA formyltransferase